MMLALGAMLHACDTKGPDFFAPAASGGATLPDVDPPAYSDLLPRLGLTGPIRVEDLRFKTTDPLGINGAAASGVDPASVRAILSPSGTPVALTRNGNVYSGSLSTVTDGMLDIRLAAKDSAGNESTYTWTFLKKTVKPTISFDMTPAPAVSTSAPQVDFHYEGRITDPFLGITVGTVMRPGVDNNCGTSDDVLATVGTGGGQVSQNTFEYVGGTFNVTYSAFNGVAPGAPPVLARYCFYVLASDRATDGEGNPSPNNATSFHQADVTWMGPPPTTGSIAGTVTVGSVPLAGISVSRGSAAPSATTGADGRYRFDQVPPGTYAIALGGIPTGTVCSPSTKTAAVTAGNETTVDFACTATPVTGSITGRVMAGSTPVPGVTVSRGAGAPSTTTGSDGRYRFDQVPPGSYSVTISNLPTGTACSPTSKTGTVVAGSETTIDFSCTASPTFVMALSVSYLHLTGFSRLCFQISTTPEQPNASYTGTITGPGVVGSGQKSGTLDGQGRAIVANDILSFGAYGAVFSVNGVTQSRTVNVTAAPGTGSC
jgi:hypothetical protein